MKNWIFRKLFAAECKRLAEAKAQADALRAECARYKESVENWREACDKVGVTMNALYAELEQKKSVEKALRAVENHLTVEVKAAQEKLSGLTYDVSMALIMLGDLEPARGDSVRDRLFATARRHYRRPARFVLEGGLPEAEVAERLRGQARNGVVEAVQTLLDRKIVELSDRATSAPSAQMTHELRDYEAGGANAIAELKVQLEELVTAPLDPAPAAEKEGA